MLNNVSRKIEKSNKSKNPSEVNLRFEILASRSPHGLIESWKGWFWAYFVNFWINLTLYDVVWRRNKMIRLSFFFVFRFLWILVLLILFLFLQNSVFSAEGANYFFELIKFRTFAFWIFAFCMSAFSLDGLCMFAWWIFHFCISASGAPGRPVAITRSAVLWPILNLWFASYNSFTNAVHCFISGPQSADSSSTSGGIMFRSPDLPKWCRHATSRTWSLMHLANNNFTTTAAFTATIWASLPENHPAHPPCPAQDPPLPPAACLCRVPAPTGPEAKRQGWGSPFAFAYAGTPPCCFARCGPPGSWFLWWTGWSLAVLRSRMRFLFLITNSPVAFLDLYLHFPCKDIPDWVFCFFDCMV